MEQKPREGIATARFLCLHPILDPKQPEAAPGLRAAVPGEAELSQPGILPFRCFLHQTQPFIPQQPGPGVPCCVSVQPRADAAEGAAAPVPPQKPPQLVAPTE